MDSRKVYSIEDGTREAEVVSTPTRRAEAGPEVVTDDPDNRITNRSLSMPKFRLAGIRLVRQLHVAAQHINTQLPTFEIVRLVGGARHRVHASQPSCRMLISELLRRLTEPVGEQPLVFPVFCGFCVPLPSIRNGQCDNSADAANNRQDQFDPFEPVLGVKRTPGDEMRAPQTQPEKYAHGQR